MFFMIASEWRPACGNGRPATARICISNWLTGAGVDRPVAGIMRPGRQLVHQHVALPVDEHLYGQQSHQVQAPGDAAGDVGGFFPPDRGRCAPAPSSDPGCGCDGGFSTGSKATVVPSRPRATITLISQAEIDKAFNDQRARRQAFPGGPDIGFGQQHGLAAAVIAEARGFHDAREAEFGSLLRHFSQVLAGARAWWGHWHR